ncbi:MAG: tRNA (adenosine(37)-N6)-dimethylallyltransferase MiaA [Lachnospiraceae bacterium]|nr:tRNA (adenosine(37)-N6)-dimethylallyltransferase MiaA [Lachnospiraceae bacterium]
MCSAKEPLIVIAGPTAVGKSDIAAELARRIDGEVISADSMQVYRYMDIGSAKVTLEEMLGVPHHMIDVCDPRDSMDAARYAAMVREILPEIRGRGHIPILCGGTGFYIQAVTRDIHFTETETDTAYREEMMQYAREHGNEQLHALLASIDPDAASSIHPNNVKRVIRALEYAKQTEGLISEHNREERERRSPYDLLYIVLTDRRDRLYERINARVDFMAAEGLVDEVAYLSAMGLTREHISMQGIGYKEVLEALEGLISCEEALDKVKLASRHYAKRQLTFFKREEDAVWLSREDYDDDTFKLLDAVLRLVSERYHVTPKKVRDPHT